jgi:hypothetical protein
LWAVLIKGGYGREDMLKLYQSCLSNFWQNLGFRSHRRQPRLIDCKMKLDSLPTMNTVLQHGRLSVAEYLSSKEPALMLDNMPSDCELFEWMTRHCTAWTGRVVGRGVRGRGRVGIRVWGWSLIINV